MKPSAVVLAIAAGQMDCFPLPLEIVTVPPRQFVQLSQTSAASLELGVGQLGIPSDCSETLAQASVGYIFVMANIC